MKTSRLRAGLELATVLMIVVFAIIALMPQTPHHAHYTLDSGQITYDGQVFKHKFSGQGQLTMKNGDRYQGNFKDGRFNGQGTFTSHEGWRYTGEFKAGAVTGSGTLTTKQNQTYRGFFKNGQYHAQTH